MQLKKIDIEKLKMGDVVSLYNENNDPAFGRLGTSEQHLKFVEGSTFEVVKSTRSLDPGMKIIAKNNTWKIDDQLVFNVTVDNDPRSKILKDRVLIFKMRPVKRIEINTFTKIVNHV